ncbi:hypothetical protein [Paractinoplanes toevensis]|uniref:Uncharacterized protein n=1 Tax=Paractinoplanes toevensis TaxID=571911 RepID=A0A919WBX2_9ACTN|nr:hypothetical protein [Actinoplanes toevensis]GIM97322.1 hypothetical protein Ato02nite_091150 [Actinoplanes toevensis]
MTDVRRWLTAAATGVAGGLLAGLYWQFAHQSNAGCEAHACWFPFYAAAWAFGAWLLPMVTWLLLLVAGYRPGVRALLVAVLGSVVFGIGARAYDAFVYGSPRPPYALLALIGAVAFLAAVALVAGRPARLVAGGVLMVLVAALVVGEVTSPKRDRLHRFTQLAAVLQLPDPARWRVVGAEAYPRYDVIQLSIEPVGGGPAITLLVLPRPGAWAPPRRCGPPLSQLIFKIAVEDAREIRDTNCTAYPGGGWQRPVFSSGAPELLDLRDGSLVMTAEASAERPVPPATLREVLISLQPATPERMAGLPAG